MENLFELEFEKYWAIPSSYSSKRKANEVQNRISSELYISSLKKDGNMSRFVKQNNIISMQSRSKSTITKEYSNKQDWVPHIVNTLSKLPNDTIIIGELYFPHGNSDTVGTILRCGSEKGVARQEEEKYGRLRYYIHDCWFYDGRDLRQLPYEERIEILKNIYEKELSRNKYIDMAQYALSSNNIEKMVDYAFSHDEEGVVLVRKDAIVEPGKRTAWKTIKVKKELQQEIDCFTTGNYKEATRLYSGIEIEKWQYWEELKTGELKIGDYYKDFIHGKTVEPITKNFFFGWAASIEVACLDDSDNIVPIGYISGIDDNIRKQIVEDNDMFIKRPCKVTCMEITKDGGLRHPKFLGFRDDIDIEDCRLNKFL